MGMDFVGEKVWTGFVSGMADWILVGNQESFGFSKNWCILGNQVNFKVFNLKNVNSPLSLFLCNNNVKNPSNPQVRD